MRPRLRALAVTASVVLASVGAPAATGGAVACAAEGPHAGLVVDTGERVIELCVALDATEVSGLRLIELAGSQHGLSYGFGLGGAAVCRLDGIGPTGDDCFASYPEYWGYWHGDGRAGWTWASSGASSHRVGDGDVEAWVWGTGDTGASHRRPPPVGIDDLCGNAEPSPSPSPSEDRPSPTTAPTTGTTGSDRASAAAPNDERTRDPEEGTTPQPSHGDEPEEDRSPDPSGSESPSLSARSTTPDEGEVLAVGVPPTDGGGPPAALFVAGALAALLAAGGWLRLRTRARGTS